MIMDLLFAFLFAIIIHILDPVVSRRLASIFRLEDRHRKLLAWAVGKRRRRKSALTRKQLLNRGVISSIDPECASYLTKNHIIELLDKRGLIYRERIKDKNFFTTLSMDIEQFFLYFDKLLEDTIYKVLNPLYDKEKIACIAVLPFPTESKSRLTSGFEMALVNCLGSLQIPIDFLTPAILRDQPHSRALGQTKEKERILILQPVAKDDHYLKRSIKYIKEHSMSEIVEILTLLAERSHIRRPGEFSVPERTLVTLNLGG